MCLSCWIDEHFDFHSNSYWVAFENPKYDNQDRTKEFLKL